MIWPLLLTHLVAFLLFIWLLKIYAIGPVLRLLDERRNRIVDQFNELDAAEKRVASLKDEYSEHLQKIDEEARKRMLEEVNRGRRIAEEIAENARTEAARIVEKAQANIQIQIEQARIQLKNEIVEMVLASTERLIHEQMNETHDRQLAHRFIDELQGKS